LITLSITLPFFLPFKGGREEEKRREEKRKAVVDDR